MPEATATQALSIGEQAKRGIWWKFLSLFSSKPKEPKPVVPKIQEVKPQQVAPRQFAGKFQAPITNQTIAEPILKELPEDTKYITFIFNFTPMKGESGSIEYQRERQFREKGDATATMVMKIFELAATKSIKDKTVIELMSKPGNEYDIPLSIKSLKKYENFIIKKGQPKTLFLLGAGNACDIQFIWIGEASIGELSADIWAGINERGDLEYYLRPLEQAWCYDEKTERCLKMDGGMPLVVNQHNEFWVGKVITETEYKPAFHISILIKEE